MSTVRRFRATVVRVVRHAPGLATVVLKPERIVPIFKAGQFLHLALDRYDPTRPWPASRVFSVASAPTRRTELRITYAVKGSFTARMDATLETGVDVWVKMPFGSFAFEGADECHDVLIAGGTGITPFVSYLEQQCDRGHKGRVSLFYGVRSVEYLLYEDLLAECHRLLGGFQCLLFVESGELESAGELVRGRLDMNTVWERTNNSTKARFYLSGPPEMVKAFRHDLLERGVPESHVLRDDWE